LNEEVDEEEEVEEKFSLVIFRDGGFLLRVEARVRALRDSKRLILLRFIVSNC
jgi:hypothetical protein